MARARIKRDADIIRLPDDFVVLDSITPEGYYKYKVKYNVDPIKIISNNAFITKIHISNKPYRSETLKTMDSAVPEDIISGIQLKTAKQKDFARAKTANFVMTFLSDITAFISNTMTSKLVASVFTGRPTIRRIMSLTPRSVKSLEKQNINTPVLETSTNSITNTSVNYSPAIIRKTAFDLLYFSKVDPASMVGRKTYSIRSAEQALGGLVSKTIPSSGLELEKRDPILAGTLLNTRTPTTSATLSEEEIVNILTHSELDYIDVEETIEIPLGSINANEFFFVFQITNSQGMVLQTVAGTVPHGNLVSKIQIPVEPPKIMASPVTPFGRCVIHVKQEDKHAAAIKLYKRIVYSTEPNTNAKYAFVGQVKAKKGDGYRKIEDIVATSNPIIYRAIAVNQSEILGTEFSSIVVNQKNTGVNSVRSNKVSNFVSLSYETRTKGIAVKVQNVTYPAIAVELLRKDLSNKQTAFTSIEIQRVESASTVPLYFEDTTVKQDHVYEYQAKLYYKEGSTQLGAKNLIMCYTPVVTNVLNSSIGEPQIITTAGQHDVMFTIKKEVVNKDHDLIKAFISEQGLTSEFQDEILRNRSKLQNLFAIRIIRTNLTTGEAEDFGIIDKAAFSDRKFGKVRNIKPLESGYSYQYQIIAYARDTETLFSTYEKEADTKYGTYTFKPFFWRHPETLKNGSIITEASLKRNHASTIFTFGEVVDIQYVTVSLVDPLPTILDAKVSKFGPKSTLVQWKLQGDAGKVDHFIIILEMLGMKSVVGKAHGQTNSNYLQFIDSLDNKEYGQLTYYIVPVYYDYTRGASIKTNSIII